MKYAVINWISSSVKSDICILAVNYLLFVSGIILINLTPIKKTYKRIWAVRKLKKERFSIMPGKITGSSAGSK